MKSFFTPNINSQGRWVRGLGAVALMLGAWWTLAFSFWLALTLVAAAGFAAFEALRGWCALRACGIKTKI